MASTGVIPRSCMPPKPQSGRMRNIPNIQHPMTKLGDSSELRITGTASPDMRRPQTVAGYPLHVASCISWADSDLVNTKKKKYNKKAMVTGSRTDGEVLEMLSDRLVSGFKGVRMMFKANDPTGGESVSKDGLLFIMYNLIGHINNDVYERVLLNLGLNTKEKISFDLFVSRFNEFEGIRRQWVTPVKRAAMKENQGKAHPEEDLRDCDVNDWAQLKVAPEAAHLFMNALKERKVDLRSLLPDGCFVPNGLVTSLQMRHALLDLGINLTDTEYKRFWNKLDRTHQGFLTIKELYALLNLTPQGEAKNLRQPLSARNATDKKPPKLQRSKTDMSPRVASKSAREFSLGRHKASGNNGLGDAFRIEALRPSSARQPDNKATDTVKFSEDRRTAGNEASDAVARSKIRAVMYQKPQGKFDCVIDCLHHKFEERYVSMTMAFKLFDIHDDGYVMHIDFRRVLTEFGFPVTAIQLGLLVQRFGMSLKHGLIGYKQLLTKLLNRSDALTSRALDDHIQAKLDGGTTATAEADSDEDAIARRLVEYLHQEYVNLALCLLRSDRRHKGVLAPAEVRSAVERCLGYSLTEKQWDDLQAKLPVDSEGNARYVDFLLSFNGAEPGSWNLLHVGTVAVPRNKVEYPPTEEVKRLERAKSEMLPPRLQKQYDHRPVDQLRRELEQFFAEHLHEVDMRFKELDKKSHKGFSQWQFGALLNLCGFPMTETELSTLWISLKLDDEVSTFDDIVKEFAPNAQAGEQKGGEASQGPAQTKSAVSQKLFLHQKKAITSTSSKQPAAPLSASSFQTRVLLKARPAVMNNWEYLRQGFRSHDPNGLGTVTFQQMQHLVESLRSGLSPEERDRLCDQFDFRKIGRCNYLAFMKAVSEPMAPKSRFVYSPCTHTLERKPKDATQPLTVSATLQRMRNKLMRQYKSLRRGFVRNDRTRCGYLSVLDFKRVLRECQVPVSDEDLYHILSEFDANMDGRISYQEFLDALLRMGC